MFRKTIVVTPLTSGVANDYFTNIQGNAFKQDNSFLATLRALVAPRIKDGGSITLQFSSSNYSAEQVERASAEMVVSAVCTEELYESDDETNQHTGYITVHNLVSSRENNLAIMKAVESVFIKDHPGYQRLEKVKEFYRKSFAVDCYINPEHKNVSLFVDDLDMKKLHYLQVSILAFLPWYFSPEEGVSELEMQLLYSLRETTADEYESCIAKIAAQYDFRAAHIQKALRGFENRFEQLECERVTDNISNNDREIVRLNRRIGELLAKRSELCTMLMGLERKIAECSNDSEIMDYFMCNKKLHLEEVTGTSMYFCVMDYLEYFDPDMAERAIHNKRSYVYAYCDDPQSGLSTEDMHALMTEIFLAERPRLHIRFCAGYVFDLRGNVNAITNHQFPMEVIDCMPNPHIDRYACMGNYQMAVNDLLKERNYIGAIEQCVASCKSLNFGDSTVMREFIRALVDKRHDVKNKCIELPDGSVVRPVEAVSWLYNQDRKQEQETEEA